MFIKLILEHHDEKESFFDIAYHNIKAVVFSLTRMNEELSVLLGAFNLDIRLCTYICI